MKKFFLNNGTEQQGPFDIEDLKTKGVSKDTPIWHDGLSAWTTVGNVEELKSLLTTTPPPFNQPTPPPLTNTTTTATTPPVKSKTNWTKWIVWGIVAIISLIATAATGGAALPVILVVLGLYFAWVKLGGLKIFSILSITISLIGILAGLGIVMQGVNADRETAAVAGFGQMGLVIGGGLIIYSIYFLAYSISVLASVRKGKLGQYETE